MLDLQKIRDIHQQKKNFRLATFSKILEMICKIVELKALDGETYCLYEVPEFIIGEPIYDLLECCEYLVTELKKFKFSDVSFYAPNVIFLKWRLD